MIWISVTDKLPPTFGWYWIKDKQGYEVKVPYVHNGAGKLVWLVPDESNIVCWGVEEIYI